jgi:hypothetical protein
VAKGPRIPRECWPEVVAQVQREGLRAVARDFGVSHETVRGVIRQEQCRPRAFRQPWLVLIKAEVLMARTQ